MASAMARCGIVGITRPNVIWGKKSSARSGTAPTGWVAEMVDPHCPHISKEMANKQLSPSRQKARAATASFGLRS